jgi:site-specific recombinase XerD
MLAVLVFAGVRPHKLRHACCSLLFVCGYELPRVMAMLGH